MAMLALPLLQLLSLLALLSPAHSVVDKALASSTFLKSSCAVTLYPALCIKSLSPYSATIQHSPKLIAQAALSVSISRAKSAKTFVTQMSKSKGMQRREYQVVEDCVENMGDSVDRLGNSIMELGHMGHAKEQSFMWHMSNVQTWVSAALTDEDTCLDGFAEGAIDDKIKSVIRVRITHVARLTSNALALVNRCADRH
ncbi:hypothetical protein ACHQM5_001279 [Ranunculus cassubicifolius]